MEAFGLSAASAEQTPTAQVVTPGSSARSAMLGVMGMRWDEAVDVVYAGSGAGGLAVSIVAVDAGQTAFVADSGPLTTGMDGRLGVNVPDAETNEYLDAVTENLAPFTRCGRDVDVPIRLVGDPLPIGSCRRGRTVVEPFVGARLTDWAARCVTARTGSSTATSPAATWRRRARATASSSRLR